MLYLYLNWYICYILVDQSLSQFSTPWTAAGQASLSFTFSWSLLTSICPSSRWCHPTISSSVVSFSCSQSFLVSGSLLMSRLFTSGGQSLGASASASVLLMNIQGWFPLGLTDLISLLSKGLSRIFSSTKVWKHQFLFMVQLSHTYMTTGKTIALCIWNLLAKLMSLLFNMLSSFVIASLPRS